MGENTYALTTTVKPEEEGFLVKDIVYGRLNLSRGLLRRMKRGGGVYLNGKRDYLTRRVRAGDRLQVVFYDAETNIEPEQIPLEIVWEDAYLLAINKPAGMVVHPSGSYQRGTLANALAYYGQAIGLAGKVRLVHRLDKDTSGLILVAKEPYTLQRLLGQLGRGELVREYLALVCGQPRPERGLITAPIGRSGDHGVKRRVEAEGKKAETFYETVVAGGEVSLLRVRLGSGRTHQIRVHLAALGHPLLGDPLYGVAVPALKGQALHAHRLEFVHPRSGKKHRLRCPLPEEILAFWKRLRKGQKVDGTD